MKNLIATLKAQHRVLDDLAARLDAAVTGRDSKAAETLIAQYKVALMAHLDLEESRLYPALKIAERANPEIVQTTRLFSENMVRITEGVTAFFRRYSCGSIDMDAFGREWKNVSVLLAERSRAEETALYSMYERLLRSSAVPPSQLTANA